MIPIWSLHPAIMSSDTSEASGGSFAKIEDSFKWRAFFSPPGTCLQGSQIGTTDLHASQGEWRWSPRSPPKQRQCPRFHTDYARHTRQWWYHITSKMFWGRDLSLTVRRNSPTYPADKLPLLFSRTIYKERGSDLKGQISPPKNRATRNQLIGSSWSRSPTYHP